MTASTLRNIQRTGLAAMLTLAVGINSASAAGSATGTLTVTATVVGVCLIGNATLAFGTYNPTSATALTATTNVTLTCALGTAYNIAMNPGTGTNATVTSRVMTASGNTLGYKLFRDSAYTLNWGQTVGTDTLSGTSSTTTLTNTIPIYGQIPAGEAAAIGSYTDTVTMTVSF